MKRSTYLTSMILAVMLLPGFALNAAAATNPNLDVIRRNPDLFPALGSILARNVVIEFADYQCPYCAMAAGLAPWANQYAGRYGDLIGAAKQVEELAKQGKIRFIFVPLSFLDSRSDPESKESTWAAEAAFCAGSQGKYWEMHDAIYRASDGVEENTGKYAKHNLENLAAGVTGLDPDSFNTCLESDEMAPRVRQVMDTFRKAGFRVSTPQFWVNDSQVEPSTKALEAALQSR